MDKSGKKDYWFEAKKYGWGWGLPITKEGWIFSLSYLTTVVLLDVWFLRSVADLPEGTSITSTWQLWVFVLAIAFLSGIYFGVSIAKGPKPRWRWGRLHKDDDPDTPLGKF